MSNSNWSCPRCDARPVNVTVEWQRYECGTLVYTDGPTMQTAECERRELDKLRTENAELRSKAGEPECEKE